MTYMQYINRIGGLRAQIEAVMIRKDMCGHGFGKILFNQVINRANERNAQMLQLTTDKRGLDAHRFYENFGFVATQEGMK